MTRGTRSLLIGVHQFLLHPLFVWLAWRALYGRAPTLRETLSILLHDLGYLGCRDLDGPEGSLHPELGARIAERYLDAESAELILFHSRTTAASRSRSCSKLCLPDKLSLFYYPAPLYSLLLILGGEHFEYAQLNGLNDLPLGSYIHQFRVTAYRWAMLEERDPAVCERIQKLLGRSYRASLSEVMAAGLVASA